MWYERCSCCGVVGGKTKKGGGCSLVIYKKDDDHHRPLNQPPSAKSTLTRKTQWRDTYKEMLHPGFFVCFLVVSFSYLLSSLLFLLVR